MRRHELIHIIHGLLSTPVVVDETRHPITLRMEVLLEKEV